MLLMVGRSTIAQDYWSIELRVDPCRHSERGELERPSERQLSWLMLT